MNELVIYLCVLNLISTLSMVISFLQNKFNIAWSMSYERLVEMLVGANMASFFIVIRILYKLFS